MIIIQFLLCQMVIYMIDSKLDQQKKIEEWKQKLCESQKKLDDAKSLLGDELPTEFQNLQTEIFEMDQAIKEAETILNLMK